MLLLETEEQEARLASGSIVPDSSLSGSNQVQGSGLRDLMNLEGI